MTVKTRGRETYVTIQCSHCAKDFDRPEGEITAKRGCGQSLFFCGLTCYHAYSSAHRKGQNFIPRKQ